MASGDTARAFHDLTKHTPESIRGVVRALDFDNKPSPFKTYEDSLDRVVPRDPLRRILSLGAGVLRKAQHGPDTFYFRTYASAGALYPVELYVVDHDGVFHFDPLSKELERLRDGDFGPRSLVLTGLPWRTCWKYGNRGYRHLFWDAGTVLANVLALAAQERIDARLVIGFDDEAVARLVGVDGVAEFPLCVVELADGELAAEVGPEGRTFAARPLSVLEERFPAIEEVHSAGRLAGADVAPWRGVASEASPQRRVELFDDIERVILRRGSARRLGPGPVPLRVLADVLRYGTQPTATDHGASFVRVVAAVHSVEGLDPGTYVWEGDRLRALRVRDVRLDAAFLCLEQRLGGEGAITFFLMSDLGSALDRFGDRGYRVVQLEGGLTLGRLDLAAHAHGLGATGLTFYDDEVRAFFSPEASSLDCMVVCAVGERRGRLLPLA